MEQIEDPEGCGRRRFRLCFNLADEPEKIQTIEDRKRRIQCSVRESKWATARPSVDHAA